MRLFTKFTLSLLLALSSCSLQPVLAAVGGSGVLFVDPVSGTDSDSPAYGTMLRPYKTVQYALDQSASREYLEIYLCGVETNDVSLVRTNIVFSGIHGTYMQNVVATNNTALQMTLDGVGINQLLAPKNGSGSGLTRAKAYLFNEGFINYIGNANGSIEIYSDTTVRRYPTNSYVVSKSLVDADTVDLFASWWWGTNNTSVRAAVSNIGTMFPQGTNSNQLLGWNQASNRWEWRDALRGYATTNWVTNWARVTQLVDEPFITNNYRDWTNTLSYLQTNYVIAETLRDYAKDSDLTPIWQRLSWATNNIVTNTARIAFVRYTMLPAISNMVSTNATNIVFLANDLLNLGSDVTNLVSTLNSNVFVTATRDGDKWIVNAGDLVTIASSLSSPEMYTTNLYADAVHSSYLDFPVRLTNSSPTVGLYRDGDRINNNGGIHMVGGSENLYFGINDIHNNDEPRWVVLRQGPYSDQGAEILVSFTNISLYGNLSARGYLLANALAASNAVRTPLLNVGTINATNRIYLNGDSITNWNDITKDLVVSVTNLQGTTNNLHTNLLNLVSSLTNYAKATNFNDLAVTVHTATGQLDTAIGQISTNISRLDTLETSYSVTSNQVSTNVSLIQDLFDAVAEINTNFISGSSLTRRFASIVVGHSPTNTGNGSLVSGTNSSATAKNSQALGSRANAAHNYSFVWNGDPNITPDYYISHAIGSFNVNPAGGATNFWLGSTSLYSYVSNYVADALSGFDPGSGEPVAGFLPLAGGTLTGPLTIGTRSTGSTGVYSVVHGNSNVATGAYEYVSGFNNTAKGEYSRAEGESNESSGPHSFVSGKSSLADSRHARAYGYKAKATNIYSFVWSGYVPSAGNEAASYNGYGSHGRGTFNLNPEYGLQGIWIGDMNLYDHIIAQVSNRPGTAIHAGNNVSIASTGSTFTVSVPNIGVSTLGRVGGTALTGAVQVAAGNNITITQTNNILNIAATVPESGGAPEGDYVEFTHDSDGNPTAITLGYRTGGSTTGIYSIVHGSDVKATDNYAVALGNHSAANAPYSLASGFRANVKSSHDYAWVWSGDTNRASNNPFQSASAGSFSIDPLGGPANFWIGTNNLVTLIQRYGGGSGGGGSVTSSPSGIGITNIVFKSGDTTLLSYTGPSSDSLTGIVTNHVGVQTNVATLQKRYWTVEYVDSYITHSDGIALADLASLSFSCNIRAFNVNSNDTRGRTLEVAYSYDDGDEKTWTAVSSNKVYNKTWIAVSNNLSSVISGAGSSSHVYFKLSCSDATGDGGSSSGGGDSGGSGDTPSIVSSGNLVVTNSITLTANGSRGSVTGKVSFAQGGSVRAEGMYSFAAGINSLATNDYSFTWGGISQASVSHGNGTFNIRPADDLNGFWVGTNPMSWWITNIAQNVSGGGGSTVNTSGNFSVTNSFTLTTTGFRAADSTTGVVSFAQGSDVVASGLNSFASGESVSASNQAAIALGRAASATDDYSFVWSGRSTDYNSHGVGTFNVDPVGGAAGFWVGDEPLDSLIGDAATNAMESFTNDFVIQQIYTGPKLASSETGLYSQAVGVAAHASNNLSYVWSGVYDVESGGHTGCTAINGQPFYLYPPYRSYTSLPAVRTLGGFLGTTYGVWDLLETVKFVGWSKETGDPEEFKLIYDDSENEYKWVACDTLEDWTDTVMPDSFFLREIIFTGTSEAAVDQTFSWHLEMDNVQQYGSHGSGTFNVNPTNGFYGFWVGETNLGSYFDSEFVHGFNGLHGDIIITNGTGIVVTTEASNNTISVNFTNKLVYSVNGKSNDVTITSGSGITVDNSSANTIKIINTGVRLLTIYDMWESYYWNWGQSSGGYVSPPSFYGDVTFGTFQAANNGGDVHTYFGIKSSSGSGWEKLCILSDETEYTGGSQLQNVQISSSNPNLLSVEKDLTSVWQHQFTLTPHTPFRVVTNETATTTASDYLLWMDPDVEQVNQTLTFANGPNNEGQSIVVRYLGTGSYSTVVVCGSDTYTLDTEGACLVFDWLSEKSKWYIRPLN